MENWKCDESLTFRTPKGIERIYLPSSNEHFLNNFRPLSSHLPAAWKFPSVSFDWSIHGCKCCSWKLDLESQNNIIVTFKNCLIDQKLIWQLLPNAFKKHFTPHTYQTHTQKYANTQPVWLNGWVLIYKISGCGLESCLFPARSSLTFGQL